MSEESGSDGSHKGQNKVPVTAEGDSPGATLDQNGIEGREIGAAELENDRRNLRAAELSNVTIDSEQRVVSQEVEPPNDGGTTQEEVLPEERAAVATVQEMLLPEEGATVATVQEVVLPEEGATVAAVQRVVITKVETQAAMSPEKRAVNTSCHNG